jgi:DNA replication protein DnaC
MLYALEVKCNECKDMGFCVVEVAGNPTHPMNGKTIPCPNTTCEAGNEIRRRQIANRFKKAGLPPLYQEMNFDTFAQAVGADWTGKALAYGAARLLAERYPRKFSLQEAAQYMDIQDTDHLSVSMRHSLVLTGDVGGGKTGLAASIFNYVAQKNIVPIYIRCQDLVAEIQATYKRESDDHASADEKFYALISAPILIMDEFNLENYTADRLEIVERVIRGRHGRNLPVVATTNLSHADFRRLWGERIADIMFTAHWCGVGGVKLRDTVHTVETI